MYIFNESKRMLDPKRKNEWEVEQRKKVTKVTALYHAGVPFFTKDAIRDLHQQILIAKNGDNVSVLGLDGEVEETKIDVGMVSDDQKEPHTEWVQYVQVPRIPRKWRLITSRTAVRIGYESIQSLTQVDGGYPATSCPLSIRHSISQHNKVTKEMCDNRFRQRDDLPREEAEAFWKTSREAWGASDPCKQFREILASAGDLPEITKVVAFACGDFLSITTKPWNARGDVRAATQHALILTLRDILIKQNRATCLRTARFHRRFCPR